MGTTTPNTTSTTEKGATEHEGSMTHSTSSELIGVVGFLTGLVVMETVLLIWLILERRRMKKELHRMTLLSVGVSSGNVNQASDFPDLSTSESARCPAMTILPALARFHSRQLSCEAAASPTLEAPGNCRRPHMDSLAQERMSRSAGELAVASTMGDFGEYACIRSSDVFGSVRRNRGRERMNLPRVPDLKMNSTESNITSHMKSGTSAECSMISNSLEGTQDVSNNEASTLPDPSNQTTQTFNPGLLRRKHTSGPDSDTDSHRYSLVRQSRLVDARPTRSTEHEAGASETQVTRTPHMSCELGGDLLQEIAIVTDITFEAGGHDDHKKSGTGSKPSSGVYEDIQLSGPHPLNSRGSVTHRQVSVTSDDLTEISDLTSEASCGNDSDIGMRNVLDDDMMTSRGNPVTSWEAGDGKPVTGHNDVRRKSSIGEQASRVSGDYELSTLARDSYNETLVGSHDELLL